MIPKFAWSLAWLVLTLMSLPACAANADLDAAFESAMQRFHLPGLAVGVIENDRVVYKRTEGELIVGSGRKIDSNTLFKIASNSKAMTASTLARLVDAGKLEWSDPVIKHLPNFRMHDDWVTRNMQVGDLLVHNSGLPEGGGDLMLWPEPNHFTRADILAGLAYIKPAYSFRAGYAYDNLLYVVAGEVAAAAGGASYEELVRREVFSPLGLGCRVGEWKRSASDNMAQPHVRRDGRNVPSGVDGETVPAITSAAAGGIRCSLDDMLTWARNWLVPDAAQLKWLSAGQRQAMWTARTPMPISDWRKAHGNTHYYAYAYGFRVADVDGEWTVSHTGTLSGMYSVMMLLPDRKSGFVMLTNGQGDAARTVLTDVLTRHFTKPYYTASVNALADELARADASDQTSTPPDTQNRMAMAPTEMASQLGVWRDPWFGEVRICADQGKVRFNSAKSPSMTGVLMRAGERILVDWDDDAVDLEAWLEFPDAAETTLRMAKVDPEGDFSFDYEDLAFTRIADCEVSPARSPAAAGMLDVSRVSPDIRIDMRYAGSDNFTGRPVTGYAAARCLLKADAAAALARMQRSLRKQSMRLHVFDCYRPARAVDAFVAWAQDPADQGGKQTYYPRLEKSKLLGDYIAPVSGHSRGFTADLGMDACNAEFTECTPLDMGTPFDFFDPRANTDSPDITTVQRSNRETLIQAMRAGGFDNYPMEWWHFTHASGTDAVTRYDFIIEGAKWSDSNATYLSPKSAKGRSLLPLREKVARSAGRGERSAAAVLDTAYPSPQPSPARGEGAIVEPNQLENAPFGSESLISSAPGNNDQHSGEKSMTLTPLIVTPLIEIDKLMQGYHGSVPGASLLVLHDGVPVLRKGYGMAELETGRTATPATNYRLASVTKQFTAAAILLLIEDGRLHLDDRLRELLPSLPPATHAITLRHLLTHSSGLIDYEDVMDPDQVTQLHDIDVLHLLEQQDRLYFEPGTRYRYSNGAYALMALIVEKHSGKTFPQFLKQRIFEPLGMHNTLAYVQGGPGIVDRAYGYSEVDGTWQRTDQSNTSAVLGDGGIYSSIDDLARWDAALYDDRLLSEASRKLAFSPQVEVTGEPYQAYYGFGWRITGDTLWHSGETIGFRNVIVRWPERKLTVILLSNRNDPEPYRLALEIASRFR